MDWPWGSAQIPATTLLPYGQLVTNAVYPALQVIADAAGRPYGGVAATNFNLPDYRGRIGAGKDDMGGTVAGRITAAISGVAGTTLGAVFGAEGITLTTAMLPAHNHSFTTGGRSAGHTHTFTTGYVSADHAHNVGYYVSGAGPSSVLPGGNSAGAPLGPYYYGTSGITVNHYHGGTTDGENVDHTHSGTTNNTGSGNAVPNAQPTIVVNKIMRVL
jgi:microcystin-dependent protein